MKIVLNMIVKNEAKIIVRCLSTLKDYVDYYVICDTGSTDGTQEIIKNFFDECNIKGEIHNTKWKNFGFNRNEALKMAKNKCDYILLIDSDMLLQVFDKDFKDKLEDDMYSINQDASGFIYDNVRLLKSNLEYEYIGVTHEYIYCKKTDPKQSKLSGVLMLDNADGSNRVDKYKRDILLLQEALQDKLIPVILRQRYYFYLAQSYRDSGNKQKAIKYYLLRADSGGWNEEVFYSYYQAGLMYLLLDDIHNSMTYLLKAFETRPTRIESLYQLVRYYRVLGKYELANLFLLRCLKCTYPYDDKLFIESNIYNFLLEFELVLINSKLDINKPAGRVISENLLHRIKTPLPIKQEVLNNMFYYVETLKSQCDSFETFQYHVKKNADDHNILNPSIVLDEESDVYLLNTREVNYTIDLTTGKYIYRGDKIKTTNKLSYLDIQYVNDNKKIEGKIDLDVKYNDKKMHIQQWSNDAVKYPVKYTDSYMFDCDEVGYKTDIQLYENRIEGFEDLRLIMFNGVLYAIATNLETNPKGINEMVLLEFGKDSYVVKNVFRLKCEGLTDDAKCEKNWTPFIHEDEFLILYTSNPTVILRCDIQTGECKIKSQGNNSLDLSTFRGSSQIIKVKDTYLYLIHQVGFLNGVRYYYHRFVHMGLDLRIKRISPMFTFSDKPTIEFCGGLSYNQNSEKLIISYGVQDNKCYLATINLEQVLQFLL